ncbi:MAG TPA: GAF domain-containing protein [Kouleothrix sp.]|uniref:GAF domain-containing protein n=1 Tax=Kouleothrix sp. TaxID=2779161 RepID=UPI002BFA04C1|nr:GAF domain-containing protein [Kouleothrix sp.]HRC75372.1 GAF domain-containing protein [Kouleothrix sp.]
MNEPSTAEIRIDALTRITEAIETAATLDELLLLALRELSLLFDLPRGGVALLNDDGSAGQVVREYPPQADPAMPLQPADLALMHGAVSRRQPIQVHDDEHADQSPRALELLRSYGLRAALLMPLIAQDHAIGMLALGATEPRQFAVDEIALVRTLASQLAAAISAFRIYDEAQRRNQELSTLNEIASTITSTLDTSEVYRLVVQRLNAYFNVEAGSLLLVEESSGDLRFVMTIEGGEAKLAGVKVPMGQGVVGAVATGRQWEIVPDAQSDPRFYRKISEDLGFVTKSILCVPMIAKGRVIGVIELLNKLDGQFTPDEAERLMRMAAFIGVAIENARLFQQVASGRDRLAAILNSTADGILMTDMHGSVLTANPMAAELFGASEQQLTGRPLDELLRSLHSRAREVNTRSRGDSNGDAETPVHVSDIELGGTHHRFIRHLSMPVRDADGAVYGQLAVLRDITQERELEQIRDDWTSMLVHDLRAPLTSIMNGVMMVKRGIGGPVTEAQNELLEIAHQGSQAMLELVNNLLDISKMEQGRMTIDLEPVAPYTIIDQALDRLRVSARSKNVDLATCMALNLPLIDADDDKIVRVLQNLIDNAIKFSSSSTSVTVGAHAYGADHLLPTDTPLHPPFADGEWIVFWVQDRGMGIPAAYHERIFEKFGQVRGRKVRGTGLGLTFCKLAVEAHHGRIWLESEEGVGSVFAFALPRTHTDER